MSTKQKKLRTNGMGGANLVMTKHEDHGWSWNAGHITEKKDALLYASLNELNWIVMV